MYHDHIMIMVHTYFVTDRQTNIHIHFIHNKSTYIVNLTANLMIFIIVLIIVLVAIIIVMVIMIIIMIITMIIMIIIIHVTCRIPSSAELSQRTQFGMSKQPIVISLSSHYHHQYYQHRHHHQRHH